MGGMGGEDLGKAQASISYLVSYELFETLIYLKCFEYGSSVLLTLRGGGALKTLLSVNRTATVLEPLNWSPLLLPK